MQLLNDLGDVNTVSAGYGHLLSGVKCGSVEKYKKLPLVPVLEVIVKEDIGRGSSSGKGGGGKNKANKASTGTKGKKR